MCPLGQPVGLPARFPMRVRTTGSAHTMLPSAESKLHGHAAPKTAGWIPGLLQPVERCMQLGERRLHPGGLQQLQAHAPRAAPHLQAWQPEAFAAQRLLPRRSGLPMCTAAQACSAGTPAALRELDPCQVKRSPAGWRMRAAQRR